jgi:hypothetical protein
MSCKVTPNVVFGAVKIEWTSSVLNSPLLCGRDDHLARNTEAPELRGRQGAAATHRAASVAYAVTGAAHRWLARWHVWLQADLGEAVSAR